MNAMPPGKCRLTNNVLIAATCCDASLNAFEAVLRCDRGKMFDLLCDKNTFEFGNVLTSKYTSLGPARAQAEMVAFLTKVEKKAWELDKEAGLEEPKTLVIYGNGFASMAVLSTALGRDNLGGDASRVVFKPRAMA